MKRRISNAIAPDLGQSGETERESGAGRREALLHLHAWHARGADAATTAAAAAATISAGSRRSEGNRDSSGAALRAARQSMKSAAKTM